MCVIAVVLSAFQDGRQYDAGWDGSPVQPKKSGGRIARQANRSGLRLDGRLTSLISHFGPCMSPPTAKQGTIVPLLGFCGHHLGAVGEKVSSYVAPTNDGRAIPQAAISAPISDVSLTALTAAASHKRGRGQHMLPAGAISGWRRRIGSPDLEDLTRMGTTGWLPAAVSLHGVRENDSRHGFPWSGGPWLLIRDSEVEANEPGKTSCAAAHLEGLAMEETKRVSSGRNILCVFYVLLHLVAYK